jgi:MFS superfamily sulfate permease-like transporter
VHDDLPCFDDAATRRGVPSVHAAFGERLAVLSGDALIVLAFQALADLDRTLRDAGIELCFAEMKDPVMDKLKRFGLFAHLGAETFFPTVGSAVASYLKAYPVEWVDWEDRRP